MIDLGLQKKFDEAKRISDRMSSIYKVMFLETNPQCVKWALSLLGRCRPDLRLPLVLPALQAQEQIRRAISQLGAMGESEDSTC